LSKWSEVFAFRLFIEDRCAALCDVERIAKVVGDDTRKLVETLLLTTELAFPLDASGYVPGNSHETGDFTVGGDRREVRLSDACSFVDLEFFLIRDRLTGVNTPVTVRFEFRPRLLPEHLLWRPSLDFFGRESGLSLVCWTDSVYCNCLPVVRRPVLANHRY
jgi:hypothetical protein